MGQLIRATTTPIEIIRFSQNARLIPSNMVDVERRKVIARHNAFQHQTTGGASVDMNFMSRVNRTLCPASSSQGSLATTVYLGTSAHEAQM